MRLELIVWADITSLDNGGWITKEDLDKLDTALCKTAGWVVKETYEGKKHRGKIWVLSTVSGDDAGGHPHVIPKGCIIERTVLDDSGIDIDGSA